MAMARGVSVHIGLNSVDPKHYQGWSGDLVACEFDANDMADLAKAQDLEVRDVLLTDDATYSKVSAAIEHAGSELKGGDLFFLTYSGHGGQVRDVSSDEPDSRDETWVLYDRQMIDDEFYALYSRFQPGVRILVLSDSCHSGTVVKQIPTLLRPEVLESRFGSSDPDTIAKRVRAMPSAVQSRVYEANKDLYNNIARSGTEDTDIDATVALISGCEDNQTSADGERNGLFTGTLKEVWKAGGFRTHRGLHRRILNRMPPDQSPKLFAYGSQVLAFLRQKPLQV
jgi:hypothetical protein